VEDIEVNYRDQMVLDQSAAIRLSLLLTSGHSITPTIEVIGDKGLRATPLPVGTPGIPLMRAFGPQYEGFILARLDAPSFNVQPVNVQEHRLVGQNRIDWVWDVLPQKEGPQVLSLMVEVRWQLPDGKEPFTYQVYRQRLSVDVDVPLFAKGSPISLYTALAAAIGGIVTWAAPKLYQRATTPQRKKRRRR
jgi:hypothetical protein